MMDRRDRLTILAAGVYGGMCSGCVDDVTAKEVAEFAMDLDAEIDKLAGICVCGHSVRLHVPKGCMSSSHCDCPGYVST